LAEDISLVPSSAPGYGVIFGKHFEYADINLATLML
jgi:hypothetical protein